MNTTSDQCTLVRADSPEGKGTTDTFCNAYNKARLTKEKAELLKENPHFAEYLYSGIVRFSKGTKGYLSAHSILGDDFITWEEVNKVCPNIFYTDQQIEMFSRTIPSLEVLEWSKKNNFVVMPAPPTALTIIEVQRLLPKYCYQITGDRLAKQAFAEEDATTPGWMIVKKSPVSNSTNRSWDEQRLLLSKFETVPNVPEMAWFVSIYCALREMRLFQNVYVRTSSLDAYDNQVYFGYFEIDGYVIKYHMDNYRGGNVALCAMRKL